MGIISKLKSALGLSTGERDRPDDFGTPVAVEREPDRESERTPETTPGSAVDDVDVEPGPSSAADDDESVTEETVTEETVADETVTDETVTDDSASSTVEAEPAMADEPEGATRTEEDGESVQSIKGIGAAYADRLAAVGVHSVSDLAEADAEELAAATDLEPGRVGKWIDQAQARSR